MARPRRLLRALLLCAVLGIGCVHQRPAERRVTTSPPPLPSVTFARSASIKVSRSAYIRVQARPGAVVRVLSVLPLVGDFFENFGTTDVATIDYGPTFDAKAAAFLGRFCPQCRAAGDEFPYGIEIALPRSAYNRQTKELRQVLTLRIVGRFGTVIYRKLVTPIAHGDPIADPGVVDRALDQGFGDLAQALEADNAQIVTRIAFHETSIQQLEDVLLAKSREIGGTVSRMAPQGAHRRFAVVIGVSKYNDPRVTPLNGAANDALAMFRTLTAPQNGRGFLPDRVVLLVDEMATKGNIDEALSRWLAHGTRDGDTVLVYFSGHGVYDEDAAEGGRKREKFFLPVDYIDEENRSPYDTAIPMQDIVEYFERLAAENVVMIFDACHAEAAQIDEQTDELHRFARVKAHNRLNAIIAAAKADQLSWEVGSRGLFTRELTRGLEGSADADSNGHVSLAEIARFLATTVREQSVARGLLPQDPIWQTNHSDGAEQLPLATFSP